MNWLTGRAMRTVPSPMSRSSMLCGREDDHVLVWQADTRSMNPSVPQSYIDRSMAEDMPRAMAEYGAQFRDDIASFVRREVIDACVLRGMFERPPSARLTYAAFVDPSGGSADSFTCAIAHRDDFRDVVMIDAIREIKAPFS